ncbi:Calcium-transporting ATPase 8, plasma membrane-type [Arachis hypogaea]|nr:Calcium-transporting ATPase 8, plasma membrane-type [Arachis hypogaea]
MEMGVILYELKQPYVYKKHILRNFYVVAAEPRIRKYIVRDNPFQHLLASPLFDPDAPYAFLLSWLHPDSVHHPFDHMHGGPILAQQDGQAVPKSDLIVDDYILVSPLVGLDMSIESLSTRSSDPFTIEPIGTFAAASGQPSTIENVDMTSEDDEDPEMDVEIVDSLLENYSIEDVASSAVAVTAAAAARVARAPSTAALNAFAPFVVTRALSAVLLSYELPLPLLSRCFFSPRRRSAEGYTIYGRVKIPSRIRDDLSFQIWDSIMTGGFEFYKMDGFPGALSVISAIDEEVKSKNVDSVFHIGDISYATGFLVEWDFFLSLINPVASRVSYMTAIGNHERDYVNSGSVYITPDSGGECGQAALVLNASRRFRYTLDLKKEEEKEQVLRKIRGHVQVIKMFVWDACKDLTLIISIVAATASLVLGIKSEGIKEGWYDGGSIAFAVILVIVVTAISDYKQSLQFRDLNEEKRNIHLEVEKNSKNLILLSGCKVADGSGVMLVMFYFFLPLMASGSDDALKSVGLVLAGLTN